MHDMRSSSSRWSGQTEISSGSNEPCGENLFVEFYWRESPSTQTPFCLSPPACSPSFIYLLMLMVPFTSPSSSLRFFFFCLIFHVAEECGSNQTLCSASHFLARHASKHSKLIPNGFSVLVFTYHVHCHFVHCQLFIVGLYLPQRCLRHKAGICSAIIPIIVTHVYVSYLASERSNLLSYIYSPRPDMKWPLCSPRCETWKWRLWFKEYVRKQILILYWTISPYVPRMLCCSFFYIPLNRKLLLHRRPDIITFSDKVRDTFISLFVFSFSLET